MNIIQSSLLMGLIIVYSIRKKSLSTSGMAASVLVGYATFLNQQLSFTLILLSFFITSSMLTKFQHEKKANLEKEVKLGGQRNYIQVFCNGLVPSIYSILYIYNYNSTTISNILCLSSANFATFLTFAFIGHYACCCGDTWASELGILNSDWPYLITTFQQVPPGTNGGISLIGTLASLMGGQVMGLVAALSLSYQYPQCGFKLQLIGITTFAGLFGSMLDSLLGATLQATYYDTKKLKVINTKIVDKKDKATQLISGYEVLDNNMVNFISSLITGILSGIIGLCLVSI